MEKVMSYLAQTKDVLMRTVKDEVGKAGYRRILDGRLRNSNS